MKVKNMHDYLKCAEAMSEVACSGCHPISCKSFSNQFGFQLSSSLHAHDNIGNQSNVDGEEYGMTLSQQLSDWNYEGVSPQSKETH
jgi:hypothetical protein